MIINTILPKASSLFDDQNNLMVIYFSWLDPQGLKNKPIADSFSFDSTQQYSSLSRSCFLHTQDMNLIIRKERRGSFFKFVCAYAPFGGRS